MTRSICFVSPYAYGYFNPDADFAGGGAERQIYLLSTSLTEWFDVHIVVGDYGQPKLERREGVTLHRAYPLKSRENALQPVKHTAILAMAMRRADADVHIYRGAPRKTVVVQRLAQLLGARWIYNIANDEDLARSPAALSSPLDWLYARALRTADGIIAQTTCQQALLRDAYNAESIVVPNGYPAPENRSKTTGEYFLWVGRLDEQQKRPHYYLDCAERMPGKQFRLIGSLNPDEEYDQRIENRVAALDNVELVGQVPPAAIHDYYRDAIALVSTSAYEGFPNVFLEAWRQGTPVVGLTVDPGRYGIPDEVCARGNLDRLVQLLRRLATDDAYRTRLAANAWDLFNSEYEQLSVVPRYRDAIRGAFEH